MPRTSPLTALFQVLVTACPNPPGRRAPRASRAGFAALAAAFALIALITAQCARLKPDTAHWAAMRGVGTITGLIVATLILQAILRSLQRQNKLVLARSLPRQVAALRVAYLLVAAVMLLATAEALHIAFARQPIGIAILGSALVFASTNLPMGIRPRLALPAWLLTLMLAWTLAARPGDIVRAMRLAVDATPWLLATLGLALAAGTSWLGIGNGDVAHRQQQAIRDLVHRTRMLGGWPYRRGSPLFSSAFERALQHVPSIPARLALGIGPEAHWTHMSKRLAVGWLIVAGFGLLIRAIDRHQSVPILEVYLALMAQLTVSAIFDGTTLTLRLSRADQALLRLAPGVPQGVTLNRVLAGNMFKILLTALAVVLFASAVGGIYLLGLPVRQGVEWALLEAGLLSGLGAHLLLRDWSRDSLPAKGSMLDVASFVLPYLVALIPGLWLWVVKFPAWPLMASAAGWSLCVVTWRWHLLSTWPAALPTGRRRAPPTARQAVPPEGMIGRSR